MAHIDRRSPSSSNDSLSLETVPNVKLAASDVANSPITNDMLCGGYHNQHNRWQGSGSTPCSNPGIFSPAKAVTSSGNLGSFCGVPKTDSDICGAGKTDTDVGGAGCSTGENSSIGSGHCKVGRSAEYAAGFKEGYSQGLHNGFQAGYEEARQESRKAAVVNNGSKNLKAVENRTDDVRATKGIVLAGEGRTVTRMQPNAAWLTNINEGSTCDSNNSSESFSSQSSAVSSVHTEPQLPVLLHNQPKQEKFRKLPSSAQEQLLAEHTTEVFHQPPSSGSLGVPSGDNTISASTNCSICMTSVAEISPYQKDQDVARDLIGSVALKRCGHHFHTICLIQMASHNTSCLTCPNCQTIHGVRMGIQPKGGRMDVRKMNCTLPGFPNFATYQISYSFPTGIQGTEHPSPGRPYHLVGFPRVAFIPATHLGDRVLKLLRVAFDRRLIFTVGTSATSGGADCVVWNGIHHKTETTNYSGHGYPDPKYLGNVLMELASFGVTE